MEENPVILMEEITTEKNPTERNKGTGAGGANTNLNGKKFEEKTNNEKRLLDLGFVQQSFSKNKNKKIIKKYDYLIYKDNDKEIVFLVQGALKKYMKNEYGIELYRKPDESYLFKYNDGRKVLFILEKKAQNVDGSVETKLWSGPSFKEEYELVLGHDFVVHYAFCVSEFLEKKLVSNNKKYVNFNTILSVKNIPVLFGDNEDYFEKLDAWINIQTSLIQ